MEERDNMTEQTTQAENMGTEGTMQEPYDKEKQKLFTQDEVNSFVRSQVSRMMKKATKDQEAEYSQRLADLQAREMKLLVKERLSDRGMPKELADVISCKDEADIDAKLDALQKIYDNNEAAKKEEQPRGFVRMGVGNTGLAGRTSVDPVREAMGL